MQERRSSSRDRRREVRYPIGGRIFWRRIGDERMSRGLLTDLSDSSMAFAARVEGDLRPGDQIELTTPDQSTTAPHQVMRLVPYGPQESLVACRPLLD